MLIQGDARHIILKNGGDAALYITSPPYWAQRNYGVAGQLGLEPTPGGIRRPQWSKCSARCGAS